MVQKKRYARKFFRNFFGKIFEKNSPLYRCSKRGTQDFTYFVNVFNVFYTPLPFRISLNKLTFVTLLRGGGGFCGPQNSAKFRKIPQNSAKSASVGDFPY